MPDPTLSPRELETLRGLAEGASQDEQARAMHVSLSTVKANIRAVYDKLHARNARARRPYRMAARPPRPAVHSRIHTCAQRRCAVTYQPTLIATAAGLTAVDTAHANSLLVDWGHYLGPCNRPFGVEGWVLEVGGDPVSVAVSASTTSATAAGMARRDLVELARLCSAPSARWATRPMLRLWREVAAPRWSYWPVTAAVAYSQNARHDGQIYRFDGWERVTDTAGGSGGAGTWTNPRRPGNTSYGLKSLWIWRYPS